MSNPLFGATKSQKELHCINLKCGLVICTWYQKMALQQMWTVATDRLQYCRLEL